MMPLKSTATPFASCRCQHLPGDMLFKTLASPSRARVFYDYDEICWTEVDFRDIPLPLPGRRTPENRGKRLAGRCFPGRVPSLVMSDRVLVPLFEEMHADLFRADWRAPKPHT